MLNRFLFAEQGFAGNREHYEDPRNSFLNEVLDRCAGIPITLSLVYIEVARRAGVDVDGVGFPGHFLVKHGGETADRRRLLLRQTCSRSRSARSGSPAALGAGAQLDPRCTCAGRDAARDPGAPARQPEGALPALGGLRRARSPAASASCWSRPTRRTSCAIAASSTRSSSASAPPRPTWSASSSSRPTTNRRRAVRERLRSLGAARCASSTERARAS